MRKFLSVLLLSLIAMTMVFAGGSSESSSGEGPVEITFWYRHKGNEAIAVEKIIEEYNASQTKYHVTGLSANDAQKVLVAVASGTGPDVYEVASAQFPTFVAQGLLEPLDEYVAADGMDVDELFVHQAALAGTVDGIRYTLPLAAYNIEMFYNKDLLAEIGYTEPPKTIEEMYEMAIKATTLDADGNIDILGYPLFPLLSARWELTYAWGGRWWSEDRTAFTPDNPGNLLALQKNVEYRNAWAFLDEFRGREFEGMWPGVTELFHITTMRFPDNVCFRSFEPDRSLTYKEAWRHVEAIAAYLEKDGVRKGDKIAVMGHNSSEWALAYFAIIRSGAIVVPLDNQLKSSEAEHFMEFGGVTVFVLDLERLEKF